MINPIPGPLDPIPPRTLNVYIFILRIEVYVFDCSRFSRLAIHHTHTLKKRGGNEIHVLSWIGEDAHHSERDEGAHRAGIVVAGDAGDCVVELRGDVGVCACGAEAWTAGIVVEEDGEEGLFIAHVEETAFVEEIETFDKGGGPAQERD